MRNAGGIWSMTSLFSKTSIFIYPHIKDEQAFSKISTLETVFEKPTFLVPEKVVYKGMEGWSRAKQFVLKNIQKCVDKALKSHIVLLLLCAVCVLVVEVDIRWC